MLGAALQCLPHTHKGTGCQQGCCCCCCWVGDRSWPAAAAHLSLWRGACAGPPCSSARRERGAEVRPLSGPGLTPPRIQLPERPEEPTDRAGCCGGEVLSSGCISCCPSRRRYDMAAASRGGTALPKGRQPAGRALLMTSRVCTPVRSQPARKLTPDCAANVDDTNNDVTAGQRCNKLVHSRWTRMRTCAVNQITPAAQRTFTYKRYMCVMVACCCGMCTCVFQKPGDLALVTLVATALPVHAAGCRCEPRFDYRGMAICAA